MTRLTDPVAPSSSSSPLAGVPVADDRSNANTIRDGLAGKLVCPFCGSQNPASTNSNTNSNGPCPRCTMEDTAATRQATKARIGPWHVLQTRNPAAPGMRYATLLALVGKGQVTARSVVRGPTTHQLWRYAAHVKGLSREFGVCYSCGESIEKIAANCPHCDRAQEPVGNPDALLESRELPAPASITPSLATVTTDDASPTDSYPIVTRQQVPALANPPLVSHAGRLRAGAEGRMDIRRRPDGKALSAMELAAAMQVAPPIVQSEGHPVRSVAISLAVAALLAGGIIGYFRPDLRRQSQNWLSSTWTSVANAVENFHLQKQPPTDQWTPPPQGAGATASSASGDPAQTSASPAAPTFPSETEVNDALSKHESASVTPPGPVQTPVHESLAQGAAAVEGPSVPTAIMPPAQPVSPPPQPAAAPDHSAFAGGAPTAAAIMALRFRALDAESRQDWAEEIRCYQQIEQAPRDLWPTDVKIRLANAQRQMGR